jgi:hypothetical protein
MKQSYQGEDRADGLGKDRVTSEILLMVFIASFVVFAIVFRWWGWRAIRAQRGHCELGVKVEKADPHVDWTRTPRILFLPPSSGNRQGAGTAR